MNEKYKIEIQEFEENFIHFKDKRIVLYGIGRYTATLLEGTKQFSFVGLMDKEPSNIGKNILGLPIVSVKEAEQIADMVVINTSETYWDVIYERVSDIKIPVYYKNGVRAHKKEKIQTQYPYHDLNYIDLIKRTEEAQVISFDFFDTLFVRRVCNPRDVFHLLSEQIKSIWSIETTFVEMRNKAIREVNVNYSLDELYEKIEEISGLQHEVIDEVKYREILLEQKLLQPRENILTLVKQVLENDKKQVYIISDMYFSESFYKDVLVGYGIEIQNENIVISNVLNRSKKEGDLWEHYIKEVVVNKSAMHVGDDVIADVNNPKKVGIDTYYTPNVWDMLNASSMNKVASHICTDYASAVMGCVINRVFNNPYVLSKSKGKVIIKNNHDMGYVVFGPVILTFLLWLEEQRVKDGVQNLIFMSRDGYFLKEDYEYLCELKGLKANSSYLGISRQLAMLASVTDRNELIEYVSMPYSGTIKELFEDRFGIEKISEIENGTYEQYLELYKDEIERIDKVRKNYLNYLNNMQFSDDSAVVDLGFYGNNQRYLNKLTDKKNRGYYFNANLSDKNPNALIQTMNACFQKKDDSNGQNSQVLKRMIFIESLLTAPYGMVKEIDAEGKFICAEEKQNQKHFKDKVEMNQGIKAFIKDYLTSFGKMNIILDVDFIDCYYGLCMAGNIEFSDAVKKSFYNDNAMMNRIESMLFY